jgi:hypothetical protein
VPPEPQLLGHQPRFLFHEILTGDSLAPALLDQPVSQLGPHVQRGFVLHNDEVIPRAVRDTSGRVLILQQNALTPALTLISTRLVVRGDDGESRVGGLQRCKSCES